METTDDPTPSASATESSAVTLVKGLRRMMVAIRDEIAAGKPAANSIGQLRTLISVLDTLSESPTVDVVKLTFEIFDICMQLLPDNTREVSTVLL